MTRAGNKGAKKGSGSKSMTKVVVNKRTTPRASAQVKSIR